MKKILITAFILALFISCQQPTGDSDNYETTEETTDEVPKRWHEISRRVLYNYGTMDGSFTFEDAKVYYGLQTRSGASLEYGIDWRPCERNNWPALNTGVIISEYENYKVIRWSYSYTWTNGWIYQATFVYR